MSSSQLSSSFISHPFYPLLKETSFSLRVTPRAQEQIAFYEETLHLAIVPGGCSGLKTVFELRPLVDINTEDFQHWTPENTSKINPLRHLLFFFPENPETSVLKGFTANENLLHQKPSSDSSYDNSSSDSFSHNSRGEKITSTPSPQTEPFYDLQHSFKSQVCLWVEVSSAAFVHGAHLDYIEEVMSQYFALYHPQSLNQCGCKASFSL